MKTTLLIMMFFLMSLMGNASEFSGDNVRTVDCSNDKFVVKRDLVHTFYIKNCFKNFENIKVKKIIVDAYGKFNNDARAEVIVDGDIKGTIYTPEKDPSYFVNIEEHTDRIQFQGQFGSMQILSIQLIIETDLNSMVNNPLFGSKAVSTSMKLALRAIKLIDQLYGYSTDKSRIKYLTRIKKQAARLYASAAAKGQRSDLSEKVRDNLVQLYKLIDKAEPYMMETFEMSNAFELVTELLTLKYEIDDILF